MHPRSLPHAPHPPRSGEAMSGEQRCRFLEANGKFQFVSLIRSEYILVPCENLREVSDELPRHGRYRRKIGVCGSSLLGPALRRNSTCKIHLRANGFNVCRNLCDLVQRTGFILLGRLNDSLDLATRYGMFGLN